MAIDIDMTKDILLLSFEGIDYSTAIGTTTVTQCVSKFKLTTATSLLRITLTFLREMWYETFQHKIARICTLHCYTSLNCNVTNIDII